MVIGRSVESWRWVRELPLAKPKGPGIGSFVIRIRGLQLRTYPSNHGRMRPPTRAVFLGAAWLMPAGWDTLTGPTFMSAIEKISAKYAPSLLQRFGSPASNYFHQTSLLNFFSWSGQTRSKWRAAKWHKWLKMPTSRTLQRVGNHDERWFLSNEAEMIRKVDKSHEILQ